MDTQQAWYIGQRTEAMAVEHLTRRSDLEVVKAPSAEMGLDFLVTLHKDGKSSGRIFGVVAKALMSQELPSSSNGTLHLPDSRLNVTAFEDFPFPVCVFCFILDSDYGYYRWVSKPEIEAEHQAKLSLNADVDLKKLTNEEIASIVANVNTWYDARVSTAQAA